MKTVNLRIAAFAATIAFSGCASSDTTMGSTHRAGGKEAQQRQEEVADTRQAIDGEAAPEDDNNRVVSADNPIGRKPSIVALAQHTPELSTFLELVRASDMITVLESPATYTVFAPTNAAFKALPAGTVEALQRPENQLELQEIIQAHLLPNRIASGELEDNMRLMTAYGEEVIVTREGDTIKVGNAAILKPDLQASNGIVHIIDKVLAPPTR